MKFLLRLILILCQIYSKQNKLEKWVSKYFLKIYCFLEKFKKIKVENEKILKELKEISKGKQLAVGHHIIHSSNLK